MRNSDSRWDEMRQLNIPIFRIMYRKCVEADVELPAVVIHAGHCLSEPLLREGGSATDSEEDSEEAGEEEDEEDEEEK